MTENDFEVLKRGKVLEHPTDRIVRQRSLIWNEAIACWEITGTETGDFRDGNVHGGTLDVLFDRAKSRGL